MRRSFGVSRDRHHCNDTAFALQALCAHDVTQRATAHDVHLSTGQACCQPQAFVTFLDLLANLSSTSLCSLCMYTIQKSLGPEMPCKAARTVICMQIEVTPA